MGKRACLWLADFLDDLKEVERVAADVPFLGSKGTTGTQASFVTLFEGDAGKGEALHIAGHLRADRWMGRLECQLMIDDAAPVF